MSFYACIPWAGTFAQFQGSACMRSTAPMRSFCVLETRLNTTWINLMIESACLRQTDEAMLLFVRANKYTSEEEEAQAKFR
jgi:hypothetical protein